MTHYIVQTAAAQMPSSNRFGRYRRVAVLEVEMPLEQVAMISERAQGCVRVVMTWERLNVGLTQRSAYYRALAVAENMAERLNNTPERVEQWRQLLASCPEMAVLADTALEAA
jgi:hypothetical protein